MQTILTSYANHSDAVRDGIGNVFLVASQDRPGGDSGADTVVLKRDWQTGVWAEIKRWDADAFGKSGYASCVVIGSSLLCILSLRTDAGQVLREAIIPDVAVPWSRTINDGIDKRVRELLATAGSGDATELARALSRAVAPFVEPPA